MIRDFTRTYLPANYGPAEEYPKHFEFDTVWDRFVAAYSFLGLGWYCFGIGSLLIAIYSIRRLPGEERMRALALGGNSSRRSYHSANAAAYRTALFYQCLHCAGARRPMKRQSHVIAERCGSIDGARRISIPTQLLEISKGCPVQARIPRRSISARLGNLKRQANTNSAVFELARAADWGGAVAIAARRESARTRVDFGTALYRGGGIGAAVTQWQQALVEDPVQQQGLSLPHRARKL